VNLIAGFAELATVFAARERTDISISDGSARR
jgi:hypothetical protein